MKNDEFGKKLEAITQLVAEQLNSFLVITIAFDDNGNMFVDYNCEEEAAEFASELIGKMFYGLEPSEESGPMISQGVVKA